MKVLVKFACIAVAAVLFAPIAFATLNQAAAIFV
jgi:hypothetical protein